MAFRALTILLLVSAPSDVPDEDLATIKRALSQWNLTVGRASGLTVLPVNWTEHATSEFGERPQAIINDQLVDEADMVLALFADRLGTPTGEAESGTAEEIQRMLEGGKHVSVLVDICPRSPVSGLASSAEKQRLEQYLDEIRNRALVMVYPDQATLMTHVNNMLSRATAKIEENSAEDAARPLEEAQGVWPYVEHETLQETDAAGRLRLKRDHWLVLRNKSGRPVYDVSFDLGETALRVLGVGDLIEAMPPDGFVRFPLSATMGGGRDADCKVSWHFADQEQRISRATIRI